MLQNPLLTLLMSTLGLVPFDSIRHEHFLAAFQKHYKESQKNIDKIAHNPSQPTFKNTIEALSFSEEKLSRLWGVAGIYKSNLYTSSFDADYAAILDIASEHSSGVLSNKSLFKRIEHLYLNKANLSLSSEELKLLEQTYKYFAKEGAMLEESDQQKLAEIRKQLNLATNEYSKNLLKDNARLGVWVGDASELVGIPESVIELARNAAKELHETDVSKKELGDWFFSVRGSVIGPVLTYAENEDLRKRAFEEYLKIGNLPDSDNKALAKKIAVLRHTEATLLGFKNYADYKLSSYMAESLSNVEDMHNNVLARVLETAKQEFQQLEAFKIQKTNSAVRLQPWDISFFRQKLKEERYDFDEEKVREYFKLENVYDAVFDLANRLYDVRFKEVVGAEVYHSEVKVFEVTNKRGLVLGHVYLDPHPRNSKSPGAWKATIRSQGLYKFKNVQERPLVSVTTNFPASTESKPSLLSLHEVTTLFHEFGHAFHEIFSNVRYKDLSGTNVPWDFVELPSQIHERWVWEPEFLSTFAKHYKTGESLPKDLLSKVIAADNFSAATFTLASLRLQAVDLAWHSGDQSKIDDVERFEQVLLERYRTNDLPLHPGSLYSTNFSHIFSGGYAAGYYSYMWSEVLAADAFSAFKESGDVYNKKVAKRFCAEILKRGGTKSAADMYKKFRKRVPNPESFFKEKGL